MDTKQKFCERMKEAIYWAKVRGARFNDAVAFAQGALESRWGQSTLSNLYNNLFGIKAGSSWKGAVAELPTWEYTSAKGWYYAPAKWRVYRSWQECLLDYSGIISTLPWYKDALLYLDNADKFLKALLPAYDEPGWAYDPNYFDSVKNVGKEIEKMGYIKWNA